MYLAFAVVVDHKSFSLKLISLGRYATTCSIILNIFISSGNSYFGQLCFLIGYNLKKIISETTYLGIKYKIKMFKNQIINTNTDFNVNE